MVDEPYTCDTSGFLEILAVRELAQMLPRYLRDGDC